MEDGPKSKKPILSGGRMLLLGGFAVCSRRKSDVDDSERPTVVSLRQRLLYRAWQSFVDADVKHVLQRASVL